MRISTFILSASVMVTACEPTAPTDLLPRTHLDVSARFTTATGHAVEGVTVVIKTWPAPDGQLDETFTGFLSSGTDGVVTRTAGPFASGRLDSVEVYATSPASCDWNPVLTTIRAINLDTLATGALNISVELPDTLEPARRELGILCAQGTELPSSAGALTYDLYLDVQALDGNAFAGDWSMQSTFYGWATGVFTAMEANGLVSLVLTPTDSHPLCGEVRLHGTVEPNGTWSMMNVVTDLLVPGWPCVPTDHRYRFFRSKLTGLPGV
jgi:hypothetical protein